VKKNVTNVPDLGKVRQELMERRRELQEELMRLYKEKFADEVQDQGDQALTSTMELLSSSLQDSRVEEYNRIIRALDMIKDGSYGICVDCHEPISEKRLKSYPNATRCILCQELFEERGAEGITQ
jgi:RNA polymerase-binding transcription factor DksA